MTDAKPDLTQDGSLQAAEKDGGESVPSEGGDARLAADGSVKDKTSVQDAENADNKTQDENAQTKGQQQPSEENKEKATEPPAKKTKLTKDTTMAATAKEGKTLLAGEKLGETRQESAAQKNRKTPLKKNSTIAKTMEEAKQVLDGNVDLNSGRRTRSQSRGDTPKPAVKKAGTMQNTAKEGKEFLSRGKGKKGKAAAVAADGDSADKTDS